MTKKYFMVGRSRMAKRKNRDRSREGQNRAKEGPWKLRNWHIASMILFAGAGVIIGFTVTASAETKPGGTDNGLTSRLVSLTDTLSGLGYGSTTNSPDWGEHWNRISTAAQWVPSGDIEAEDVVSGKTFYNDSRTEQTGTYPAPGACPTNNCTDDIEWSTPSDGIANTDKQDMRTGLIWSTVIGTETWNTTTCSNLGDGWRSPSQRELMQAYIDGANTNLTNPGSTWSAQFAGGFSYITVDLSSGYVAGVLNNQLRGIRCVR